MRKINVGIVGMGFVGPIHMEALQRLNCVNIAIAEANREKAKKTAEIFNVNKYYSSWEDMVNDPEIEVVHICAPNNLHYDIAKTAISLGKHVVCDKPLTLNIKQSEELVELARKKNVVNAVTFNMAYYPLVQQAKSMVLQQELGRINYVQGYYLQDWLFYSTDYNWRVESKYQGASRIVGDIGVHCLHMIQEIIGQRIVEIYADFNTFHKTRMKPTTEVATYTEASADQEYHEIEVDTEDQATLLLKFDGGTKGVFIGGQVFAGRKNRIGWELYGSKMSLAWNGEEPNQLWIGNRSIANQILMKDISLVDKNVGSLCNFAGGLQEGYSETWKNLMSNIYQAILDGKPNNNYPTFEDGLSLQRVVDAAVDSSRLKQWVSITY